MEYIIVTAKEKDDPAKAVKKLEHEVQKYIWKGYKPTGGVAVEKDSSGNYVYVASQAMTKD